MSLVNHCSTCSRVLRASCLTCSRVLRASCLKCSRALRAPCSTCSRASRFLCSRCSRASHASYFLRSCVLRTLVFHVLSCLACPSCLMFCVLYVNITFSALASLYDFLFFISNTSAFFANLLQLK